MPLSQLYSSKYSFPALIFIYPSKGIFNPVQDTSETKAKSRLVSPQIKCWESLRVGERRRSREAMNGSWAAGLNLLLFFQGGMGTVTTAVAMSPFLSPWYFPLWTATAAYVPSSVNLVFQGSEGTSPNSRGAGWHLSPGSACTELTETQIQPWGWNKLRTKSLEIKELWTTVCWDGQLDWQPWLLLFAVWGMTMSWPLAARA